MIKAVIFDMDGVIVDTEKEYVKLELELSRSLNIGFTASDFEKYAGVYFAKMWEEVIDRFQLDISPHTLIEREEQLIEKYYKSGNLHPVHATLQLIKSISKQGIKCAIATSSLYSSVMHVINRLKLQPYITAVVSGDMVDNNKPAPDIYIEAMKTLRTHKGNCVVIEDSSIGCKAARNAGIKVVGFQNSNSGNQDLSQADYIVDDIAKITITLLNNLS